MLEEILNEIGSIHPFLKTIFEIALFSIIVIISIIPISFIINLINNAVDQSFLKLVHSLDSYFKKFKDNIFLIIQKFKDFHTKLITNNQSSIDNELVTEKIDTSAIKKNMDEISAELSLIPGMVFGKDKKVEDERKAYNNEINKLSNLKLSKLNLQIPEARINPKVEQDGNRALVSAIICFVILLGAVALNTFLLKELFGLMGLKKPILIKPIIITAAEGIAFMFCILEASVGFYFGKKAFEKEYAHMNQDNQHYFSQILEKFYFYSFFALIFIEFAGYLILGVLRKIGGYKNIDILSEKDFSWLELLDMSYLSVFGAAIVVIISGLSHKATEDFFISKENTGLKKLKRDLDKQQDKVNSLNQSLGSISNNVSELVEKIKNIQIQKLSSNSITKNFQELSKKIKTLFSSTNKEVEFVKKSLEKFTSGKVNTKMTPENIKTRIYMNIKNILIFLIASLIIFYSFPNEVFIAGIDNVDSNMLLIFAFFFSFLLLAIGNQLSQRKKINLDADNKERIYDPNTFLMKFICYTGILLIFTFHAMLHLQFSETNYVSFVLSILSCVGFLYVGYTLLVTMASVELVFYAIFSFVLILLNTILGIIVFIIEKFFNILKAILEIGSNPWQRLALSFKAR